MRFTMGKGTRVIPGAWVGIAPQCRTSILQNYGFTEGQIARLKAGSFVAVKESGDVWLCWDIKGREVHIKVPKTVLRVFSEVNPPEEQPEPPGYPAVNLGGCGPVDPLDILQWSNDHI